jgi:hypothetical protein
MDEHVTSIFRFEVPVPSMYKQVRASTCYVLHADLLLGPFFDPKEGGDLFLQNVG